MNKQLAEFIRTFALVFLDISLAFGEQLGDPAAGKRVALLPRISNGGAKSAVLLGYRRNEVDDVAITRSIPDDFAFLHAESRTHADGAR